MDYVYPGPGNLVVLVVFAPPPAGKQAGHAHRGPDDGRNLTTGRNDDSMYSNGV